MGMKQGPDGMPSINGLSFVPPSMQCLFDALKPVVGQYGGTGNLNILQGGIGNLLAALKRETLLSIYLIK